MKVLVDPACNINYCSFYIKGLYDLYGEENVKFATKPFKNLIYTHDSHNLAFVVNGIKYVIDCADSNSLFYDGFLEWADIYGKVNYKQECLPEKWRYKIKKVGPNFGIGIFGKNKYESSLWALINYFRTRKRLKYGFKRFLSQYLWLYKRFGLTWEPLQSAVGSNTIFMVSRYWKGQPWVNEARINFIRACRRLESEGLIKFTGGMVPDTKEHDCPSDVLLSEEIPMTEYMDQMGKSLLVFNTPAYHKCHGWKLPEYLSQGKIILTTPFENELPVPLEHRESAYFADEDEESLYVAIREVVSDTKLQLKLENGSRELWSSYYSPKHCVCYLINQFN